MECGGSKATVVRQNDGDAALHRAAKRIKTANVAAEELTPADEREGRCRYIKAGLTLRVAVSAASHYLEEIFKREHKALVQRVASRLPPGSAVADVAAGPTECNGGTGSHPVQAMFVEEFVKLHHTFPLIDQAKRGLTLSNANAQLWADEKRGPCEMAKVYSSRLGEHLHAHSKTEFGHLDGTAIFNMLSWFRPFEARYRGRNGFGQAAVTARNRWGHEGAVNFELTVAQYNDDIVTPLDNVLRAMEKDCNDSIVPAHLKAVMTVTFNGLANIQKTEYTLLPGSVAELKKTIIDLTIAGTEMRSLRQVNNDHRQKELVAAIASLALNERQNQCEGNQDQLEERQRELKEKKRELDELKIGMQKLQSRAAAYAAAAARAQDVQSWIGYLVADLVQAEGHRTRRHTDAAIQGVIEEIQKQPKPNNEPETAMTFKDRTLNSFYVGKPESYHKADRDDDIISLTDLHCADIRVTHKKLPANENIVGTADANQWLTCFPAHSLAVTRTNPNPASRHRFTLMYQSTAVKYVELALVDNYRYFMPIPINYLDKKSPYKVDMFAMLMARIVSFHHNEAYYKTLFDNQKWLGEMYTQY